MSGTQPLTRKESLVAEPQHPYKPARAAAAATPLKHLHPTELLDSLGDSRDVPMASADDLLSEIVGGDVERLMSGEYDPIVTPGHRAVERLQHQIGKFLDEVRQREQAAPPRAAAASHVAPAAPPSRAAVASDNAPVTPTQSAARPALPRATPAPVQPHQQFLRDDFDDDYVPPLDDLVGPTREQLVGLHSGEFEATDAARGPAESRALLAPVDESANESAVLKPLNWMSDPIAHMSGRARVAVSMLAVMSFLGGCAALGYVLMLRHGGI
jgi:hypothetical protein